MSKHPKAQEDPKRQMKHKQPLSAGTKTDGALMGHQRRTVLNFGIRVPSMQPEEKMILIKLNVN